MVKRIVLTGWVGNSLLIRAQSPLKTLTPQKSGLNTAETDYIRYNIDSDGQELKK